MEITAMAALNGQLYIAEADGTLWVTSVNKSGDLEWQQIRIPS